MAFCRSNSASCWCDRLIRRHFGARHVTIESPATCRSATLQRCRSINLIAQVCLKRTSSRSESLSGMWKPKHLGRCRASPHSADQQHAILHSDVEESFSADNYAPIVLLWVSLSMLVWCTRRLAAQCIIVSRALWCGMLSAFSNTDFFWACRASVKFQAAAFLLVEAVYIWLHIKPLVPILAAGPAQPDISFLRCYTTGAYFATELALFWLLGFASPIRYILNT